MKLFLTLVRVVLLGIFEVMMDVPREWCPKLVLLKIIGKSSAVSIEKIALNPIMSKTHLS